MISFNVPTRLVKIKGTTEGSGFIIDRNNSVFLVTARHSVEDVYPNSKMYLLFRHWKGEVLVYKKECYADVCVMLININNIFSTFECKFTIGGLLFGQEMYVAGFPLGYEIYNKIEGEYELFLFIKRTTIATLGDGDKIYIDTKVNNGFSGAPLFFHSNGELIPRIAGVVSSYCTKLDGFSMCYKINVANMAIDNMLAVP